MPLLHLEVVEKMVLVKQHPFGVELDTLLAQQFQLALNILPAWDRTPIAFEATNVLGKLINS